MANEIKIRVTADTSDAESGFERVTKSAQKVSAAAKENISVMSEAEKQWQEVGESASKAGSSIETAGKKSTEAGENANKSATFFGKLANSFKRIFLYRAVRKVISEIGQAAKDGIGNLYNYSAALGSMDSTHAKSNLDSLATSALYVKNSLGAMLSPIIQAITPIVYQMADAFALAANAINQFFAAIVGNASFTKAVRFPTEMKSGLSGATSAAKELRRTLLGFDEINRLDMETPSSGGGGASSVDYSSMFEEAQVSEKIKRIAEKVKELLPVVASVAAAFAAIKLGSNLASNIKAISTLLGGISPTALAAAGGVAVLGYAIYDAYQNNEDFRTGVNSLKDLLETKFLPIVSRVTEWIASLSIKVGNLKIGIGQLGIDSVTSKFKNWSNTLLSSVPIVGNIYNKIKLLGDIINNSSLYADTMKKVLIGAFTSIQDAAGRFGPVVGQVLSALLTPLNKIASIFDKLFGTNYSAAITEVQNTVKNYTNTQTSGGGGTHGNTAIHKFASGGFPTSGQLFMARENGIPEMIGTIGGQTAVANNEQIVTAIEQGVYRAMTQSGQNITVNVDGNSLFEILVNRNNSQVRTTGKSPLLV